MTNHGFDDENAWGCLLAKRFRHQFDFVNRGFSGYNSRWICHFLQEQHGYGDGLYESVSECFSVVLWVGANDAVLQASGFKQYVSLGEFQDNLKRIVETILRASPCLEKLILLTPPPVHVKSRLKHQKQKYGDKATGFAERTPDNTRNYALVVQQVSRCFTGNKVKCIDLFSAFMETDLEETLSDGLHLSAVGNKLVYDLLKDEFKAVAPLCPPLSSMKSFGALERGESTKTNADLVMKNCNVWDWESYSFRKVNIIVSDGKIQSLQSGDDVLEVECECHDLQGRFVLPGLSDSHIHVYHMGENRACVSLEGCKSIEEMLSRLSTFCQLHKERDWIVGVGWDHEDMQGQLPCRQDLDRVLGPNQKAFLWRICFHIGVASTSALKAGGIDVLDPKSDIQGGSIDRDSMGAATGILRETAVEFVTGHITESDRDVQKRYILDGLQECLEAGLTSVQTNDEGVFEVYRQLDASGFLPIRVYLTARHGEVETPFRSDSGMLCCERVKIFTDGALGANTAALRDGSGVSGILVHTQEKLNGMVASAHETGMRVEAHAIGDAAAEAVICAVRYAKIPRNCRPVLTHCQVLGPDLVKDMAELGIIANVQPSFVPTDCKFIRERLDPNKIPYSYCWKTLIEHGVAVVGSSDAPVETCSPLQGMFDAMFRPAFRTTAPPLKDSDVFLPSETLSFWQSLALYTICAQYAAGYETRRGRIEPQFDADFTVIDTDILNFPEKTATAKIHSVYVAGKRRLGPGDRMETTKFRNSGPYAPGKGGDPLSRCGCNHKVR